MKLNALYEKKDDIPEACCDLYTEKDGKWQRTGVEGVHSAADFDKVNTPLVAERTAHAETPKKLRQFEELDLSAEELRNTVAERDELKAKIEAGAGDKFEQVKFDEAVEAKLRVELGPCDRMIEELTDKLTESAAKGGI